MKFSPDLQKRILEELREFPSIRRAAKKVGLHHSTLYKWVNLHPSFGKEVNVAIDYGRDMMVEVAENALLQNVNKGDMGAIKYFLSHNEQRYMTVEKSDQQGFVYRTKQIALKTPIKDGEDFFHDLYKHMHLMEEGLGMKPDFVTEWVQTMFRFVWEQDSDLKEVFLAGYPEWKRFEDHRREELRKEKERAQDRLDEENYLRDNP